MKYYSGLVIHSDDESLYEGIISTGMKLDKEPDGNGDPSFRQVGFCHSNPLQVVSDYILENDLTVRVTLEETVDGDAGSLGDIFTEFTYENGFCVDVTTEWVEC